MGRERRLHERFTINQLIELSHGKETIVPAQGINISEGGILCKTEFELDLQSRLSLLITLPAGSASKTITCETVVVRCEKSGKSFEAAMEFAAISPENKKIIKEHIKRASA